MRKHRLLIYDRISARMRRKLLLLMLIFIGLGSFDIFIRPVFGNTWYILWIIVAVLAPLWFYYAFLVRRAAVVVKPQHLILRGPLRRVKISYGRIATVVSTKPSQHIQLDRLPQRERGLLEPYLHITCLFIEMNSFPKRLKKGHRWFLRCMFSNLIPGLILIVPDWMALSREIEKARAIYRDKHHEARQEDKRSLASRILDY